MHKLRYLDAGENQFWTLSIFRFALVSDARAHARRRSPAQTLVNEPLPTRAGDAAPDI